MDGEPPPVREVAMLRVRAWRQEWRGQRRADPLAVRGCRTAPSALSRERRMIEGRISTET